MDKANPSVVVAGYIKVAPGDREAFVKVLQADVLRARIDTIKVKSRNFH
jgi:hypothetical protein